MNKKNVNTWFSPPAKDKDDVRYELIDQWVVDPKYETINRLKVKTIDGSFHVYMIKDVEEMNPNGVENLW